MISKKSLTIRKIQSDFIHSLLIKRQLKCVGISTHFIDRIVTRHIDSNLLLSGINNLADNICQVIYECEIGNTPTIKYKDLIINIKYAGNGRIVLATCYQTTNRI